jgi:hypothetical protein
VNSRSRRLLFTGERFSLYPHRDRKLYYSSATLTYGARPPGSYNNGLHRRYISYGSQANHCWNPSKKTRALGHLAVAKWWPATSLIADPMHIYVCMYVCMYIYIYIYLQCQFWSFGENKYVVSPGSMFCGTNRKSQVPVRSLVKRQQRWSRNTHDQGKSHWRNKICNWKIPSSGLLPSQIARTPPWISNMLNSTQIQFPKFS